MHSLIKGCISCLLCPRHNAGPESCFLDPLPKVETQKDHIYETDPLPTHLTWWLNATFISLLPSNLSISCFSIIPVTEELALVQPLKDNSFPVFYSGLYINHIVSFQIVHLYNFPGV